METGLLDNAVLDVWGRVVTVKTGQGDYKIRGVFDLGQVAEPMGNGEIKRPFPSFLFRAVDYPNAAAVGDLISDQGVDYSIIDAPVYDGTGFLTVSVNQYS